MRRIEPIDETTDEPARLLGLDIGGSTIKIVLSTPGGEVLHKAAAPTQGRPVVALAGLLDRVPRDPNDGHVRIAVTGSAHALSTLFPCIPVNEVVATARGVQDRYPQARTAIDLGGQLSKWILLGDDASQPGVVVDFASNGLCAAGAGAFLEQQASRLGIAVEELGRLADGAPRAASIAGRCSVFAKSDMIHLQQKGTPPDEIAYGLCLALARTFLATVMSGRALSPSVVLVGGGACNPGLVRAFRSLLKLGDGQFFAAAEPVFLGAIGAARMAETAPVTDLSQVLSHVTRAVGHGPREDGPSAGERRPPSHAGSPAVLPSCDVRSSSLPPLGPRQDAAPVGGVEDPGPITGHVHAFLGVDVGSVSTNLVLLSPDFDLLQGIYLPTRGRPVEVLQQGLERISQRFGDRLDVRAVGTTGSGRHLAARLLGADVVHNEITAQMVSALHFAPETDTIFEIGGQDSKYISIRDRTSQRFRDEQDLRGRHGFVPRGRGPAPWRRHHRPVRRAGAAGHRPFRSWSALHRLHGIRAGPRAGTRGACAPTSARGWPILSRGTTSTRWWPAGRLGPTSSSREEPRRTPRSSRPSGSCSDATWSCIRTTGSRVPSAQRCSRPGPASPRPASWGSTRATGPISAAFPATSARIAARSIGSRSAPACFTSATSASVIRSAIGIALRRRIRSKTCSSAASS